MSDCRECPYYYDCPYEDWKKCTHQPLYKKIRIKDEDTGKYYYLIVDQNGIVRKVVEDKDAGSK